MFFLYHHYRVGGPPEASGFLGVLGLGTFWGRQLSSFFLVVKPRKIVFLV